jgi:DNA-binding MarR family transcriptional regulator
MPLSKLAFLVSSELSRLSHLLTRLERRGFVRRGPDPEDRRRQRAVLTDVGYTALVAAAPDHARLVKNRIVGTLSDEELDQLTSLCHRIVDHLRDDN